MIHLRTERDLEVYKEGFVNGLDIKQNFKFTIFGLEIGVVMDILSEHVRNNIKDDINVKIIKAIAKSGYSSAIVMMELERAGLKIVEK